MFDSNTKNAQNFMNSDSKQHLPCSLYPNAALLNMLLLQICIWSRRIWCVDGKWKLFKAMKARVSVVGLIYVLKTTVAHNSNFCVSTTAVIFDSTKNKHNLQYTMSNNVHVYIAPCLRIASEKPFTQQSRYCDWQYQKYKHSKGYPFRPSLSGH